MACSLLATEGYASEVLAREVLALSRGGRPESPLTFYAGFSGAHSRRGMPHKGTLDERRALFFAIRHGAARMTASLMHRRP
jgi:hypothetical protein